jgi:hypothetical protein
MRSMMLGFTAVMAALLVFVGVSFGAPDSTSASAKGVEKSAAAVTSGKAATTESTNAVENASSKKEKHGKKDRRGKKDKKNKKDDDQSDSENN